VVQKQYACPQPLISVRFRTEDAQGISRSIQEALVIIAEAVYFSIDELV
jgi:hypothetical protein